MGCTSPALPIVGIRTLSVVTAKKSPVAKIAASDRSLGLPPLEFHPDRVFGPKRDQRLHLDPLIRLQAKMPFLRDRGENQDSFHPRETFSDATAGATTEREIRELRSRCASFRRPAVRIKTKWIGEVSGVVMHDILAHQQNGPGRDRVAADLAIVQSAASH